MRSKADDFKDSKGNWQCIKCGACCHTVWLVYPELDRGDGACVHLLRDNTCEIYETRPPLCRVSKKVKQERKEELIEACLELRDEYRDRS